MKKSTSDLRDELLAAWALAHLGRPRLRDRMEAVRREGSCLRALQHLDGGLTAALRLRAEHSLGKILDAGLGLLAVTDPEYPKLLASIPDPPPVLAVWGSWSKEHELSISLVGSRRATPYGLETGRLLARDLAAAGLTIVSGLARGIDAAAHRGALEAGGRTVAVLGSGLARLYPREHRLLAEAIVENGVVFSEFDLDEPPRARNFPRRNRIITGLSLGTIVVEATCRSGSLVSARHALDQDRDVFAVPGPVRAPGSEGVHALLRDGARLVTRAEDVLEELHPDARKLLTTDGKSSPPTTVDVRDRSERAILEALAGEPDGLDVDTILDRVGLATEEALAAIGRLEVREALWVLPSGHYLVRR